VDEYELIEANSFEKSLKEFVKKHLKKNKPAHREFFTKFEELKKLLKKGQLDAIKHNIISHPCQHILSTGCRALKIRLIIDSIGGASGHIRIIAIQCPQQGKVFLLRIYTHEKYTKQPPDEVLKEDYREVSGDC